MSGINENEPIIIMTADAARMLGISVDALWQYTKRFPDLRPARRISGDDLLWMPAEVERVREHRAQPKGKGGRKPKQQNE